LSLHLGIVYGQYPLLDIEPESWYTCIMHMNLRIVGGLFVKTVVDQVGKLKDNLDTSQTLRLWDLLKSKGLYMKQPKLKAKSKKLEQYDLHFKSHSFAGRDAEILMRVYGECLDIIYPATQLSSNTEAREQVVRARSAWNHWAVVWKLLNTDIDYGDFSKETIRKVRLDQADRVRDSAFEFRKHWVAAVGATQGLYMHIVCAHIPDEVARAGDLRPYQTQGLEHCHKKRKQVGFNGTNRKKGQRTGTMMTNILVLDHVSKELSETQYASEHTKKKEAQVKRLFAKIERLKSEN
jgi:hypothetical protein